MKKRETTILELLSECGRMEVAALAEKLSVSQVTVRKDLDALERKGILRREHGCAVFGGTDDINNRLAFHYEEKRCIAQRAAELVSPGETVMIENGSCCALLAEQIARTKSGATIITNSAFIASYIRRIDGARVVLLGGDFQNDAQVMVGPILRTCAKQFYVNKLFVGTDGYSEQLGDMAEQAEQIIVVTESMKFSQRGVVPLGLTSRPRQVVTDSLLEPEKEAALRRVGIVVHKAEVQGSV